MTFLIDVNVIIALIDPRHVAHDDAHAWFASAGAAAWATCPITENGVIRIVGNPRYPHMPGSPAAVAEIVAEIVAKLAKLPGHVFWPDDMSIVDSAEVDFEKIMTSAQVTDAYLLALAKAHDGQLASFDRKLSTAAVKNGKAALHLIMAR